MIISLFYFHLALLSDFFYWKRIQLVPKLHKFKKRVNEMSKLMEEKISYT